MLLKEIQDKIIIKMSGKPEFTRKLPSYHDNNKNIDDDDDDE